MPDYIAPLALIGVVLTVSALASGFVERAPLSFPILFLALGFLLGEHGVGLLAIEPHNAWLEVIAVVSLAFVLFLDALKLRPDEIGGRGWFVPVLILGPGTLLIIALVATAAHFLLRTSLVESLLLGAILASTDPVVLRDVVRDRRLPRSIRQTLSIEAGTNDLVVLPIVLVLIAVARGQAQSPVEWGVYLAKIFLLGPAIGFAIGGGGSVLMARLDARMGIRREYQALYGVGLVLVAYAVAVAAGADGFLAAFAAGAATVVLDQEMCDCFVEYGETTAEMTMLIAFVFFGAVLSDLLPAISLLPALVLALLALVVVRPLAIGFVLHKAAMSRSARLFIGWFGPRGLNSLLLALLAVQARVPRAEWMLAVTGVVVLTSVLLHGATATPLSAWYGRRVGRETLPEERESTAAGLLVEHPQADGPLPEVPRISIEDLARRMAGPDPPLVIDVRSRSARDGTRIPGSIAVLPDEIAEWAADRTREQAIVTYCT
jgi:NhaP-type Na+/H+ or K+/H+ antiporter